MSRKSQIAERNTNALDGLSNVRKTEDMGTRSKLSTDQARDLDRLVVHFTTKRTARAWLYREQLRYILDRRQFDIVSAMLAQWCSNVTRSKVEPMKQVATMIRTISTASSPGPDRARPTDSSKP